MDTDDFSVPVFNVNESLPTTSEISNSGHINVINFVQARAKELLAFEKDLTCLTTSTQNDLQKMPIRLRRRASSHMMRRIPRRFHRPNAVYPNKSKRPRRQFRRRPTRLLADFCKRSSKNRWMETHLWHAKRFHMETRWNCRIPVVPNDKVFRVCHRASMRGCLALDLSYFCFIELIGREKYLLSGLKRVLCPITVRENIENNSKVLTGESELSTIFYHTDSYPYRVIGPVKMLWSPEQSGRERKVWLWCHPSVYESLHNQLTEVFPIKGDMQPDSLIAAEADSNRQDLKSKKLVQIRDLRNELLRFRLIGAQSLDLLLDIVSANRNAFLQRNCVVHCTALDPRYRRPEYKLKDNDWRLKALISTISEATPPEEIEFQPSTEFLFNEEVRKNAFNTFTSVTSKTIALNKKSLVPCPPDHAKWSYPCTIIKQSDHSYDLLLPRGLARAFWLGIIYRGAEPGSQRELRRYASLEMRDNKACIEVDSSFPFIGWPDSPISREEHLNAALKLRKKYRSRPPSKRCSYQFYGTVFPFFCAWSSLLPSDNNSDWFVLRDKQLLTGLLLRIFRGELTVSVEAVKDFNPQLLSAYVMVHLKSVNKGIPSDRSIICLPTTESDFKSPPQEPPLTNNKVDGTSFTMNATNADNVRITANMSRPVIGFVEAGETELSTGGSGGVGYLSLYRLLLQGQHIVTHSISLGTVHVLFKSTTTNQYRLALASLVV